MTPAITSKMLMGMLLAIIYFMLLVFKEDDFVLKHIQYVNADHFESPPSLTDKLLSMNFGTVFFVVSYAGQSTFKILDGDIKCMETKPLNSKRQTAVKMNDRIIRTFDKFKENRSDELNQC
uniref:Uncharacterized protein n=1 Tax=Glossina brevipalpis TaxID=37001 RepID=A0A1A9X4W6_9MUSC